MSKIDVQRIDNSFEAIQWDGTNERDVVRLAHGYAYSVELGGDGHEEVEAQTLTFRHYFSHQRYRLLRNHWIVRPHGVLATAYAMDDAEFRNTYAQIGEPSP